MMTKITEYNLSTPFDVSTATFTEDGSIMYIVDNWYAEEEVRDKYPEVKRAYEEYRMALVLYGGEDL